ncbi:T9SS type A sorting domain-containing protein [Ginsengibacter hankyongi]|uniref:T9SS type A sorting domain-containing protein n=1 Tax=Ginsengibacter hankyongi TaxID=2607284 RepID=A0A5J5IJ36_9BACT|nr:T9SS type A sorting domain-containing protein [Ginsengibacter hankyongi]KAA9039312.1 T9SS type A sorting domain-containing protein [Ginsengibacter hankyongi]
MKNNLKFEKLKAKATKVFFVVVLLTVCISTKATDYYMAASGNDANSGTSASSPWQTLNKLNSVLGSLSPGDNILFNRGDVFYGSINIRSGGSSGSPVTFSAYGSGANPIITGFTNVTSWINLGNNIWESSNPVSNLPSCNMVVINGVNTPMGRWPNTGYLTYESFSGNSSITSSSISSSTTDWTGAEIVIKKIRWVVDRGTITSASGSTLNYSPGGYPGQAGWGFFIQNDARTLDSQNEWYYNPSSKKIRVYSTNAPTNVLVSSIDKLVNIQSGGYITFSNLSFTGANDGIYFCSSPGLTIENCSFDFNYNGIYGNDCGGSSANFKLQNSIINHSNNNAIDLPSETIGAVISNNVIKNSGILIGMSGSGDGKAQGMNTTGAGSLIQYNEVDSSGYIGIGFDGNNVNVSNNLVNYFCLVKDDGGGIYTANQSSGKMISSNIVLNGIGTDQGTNAPGSLRAHGIFCDNNTTGVTIQNNSVANMGHEGITLHDAAGVIITNNTVYNTDAAIAVSSDGNGVRSSNITITNNIFFARSIGKAWSPQNQLTLHFATIYNDISSFGSATSIDNNYYARPIDDSLTLVGTLIGTSDNNYSLTTFHDYSGYDAHSHKSPKTITDLNDLRFEYNATNSNKTISLPYSYIDVKNNSYNGTITLAPYTSAVLIKNGPASGNQAPVANAGSDGSITLPTNTVTLSGSGTDADGTISSYKWTQVSGPSFAIITSPNSATTSVSSMIQGTYKFQLQVTDNNGATGEDTVQISVISSTSFSGNIAPVADAGGDGSITLPTNSVPLTGTGTDSDGTVVGFQWSQVSGPSTASIVSPNTAATMVTGLIAGVYQFKFQVTDNDGALGTSTVNITVTNSSNNISPVADAGGDGTITLPTNSVPLTGSGTDADGTVVGYKWSQVSGPATASIMSPNTAATLVTGMIAGLYQFQLTVTDNSGGTGTATVNIRVVNSSNISPVADAGGDGTIVLPINSVPLTGTGTDADGTVVGYKWSQVSGPATASIISPNTAATWVTGMIAGLYQFQLTVTDNSGATGTSTVNIRVINSSNISPVADAGGDGTITLPTNSVPLTGTGTDVDGTIVAYQWSQISGPSGANITSPNTAATTVTNMVEGTYQFQLTVTDNSGATGSATVNIRVVTSVLSGSISNSTSISSPVLGVTAYPNPFTDYITLNILGGVAGPYSVIIVDASGQMVWSRTGVMSSGTFQLSINTSALKPGIYFLKFSQNSSNSVIKMEKLK